MQTLIQDLHYALRQLGKSPRFTLTSIVSLALGIGATTAIFSVTYAALLNPYPYPSTSRIVRLTVTSKANPDHSINLSDPQVIQLQQVSPIQSVLAMAYQPTTLTGPEFPENVNVISLISTGFEHLQLSRLSAPASDRDAMPSTRAPCRRAPPLPGAPRQPLGTPPDRAA